MCPRISLSGVISIAAIAALSALLLAGCKSGTPTGPSTLLELAGQILQSGQPLAGVRIFLSWKASLTTVTGADGKFSFSNLAAGSYIVTPTLAGAAFSPSNYEVASTRKDLNFTAGPASYGTEVGSIAPNFSGRDQGNALVSLADFHGWVVLFDFTADWCTPCREKAETAEAFYQKYKDGGFMSILIVIDGVHTVWAETYGLTFPVLDDRSQTIYNQFRKNAIPLPHVLDRNGTIRYKAEGWNKSEVEDIIAKYL